MTTNGQATVYEPTAQGSADTLYQQIVASMANQFGGSPATFGSFGAGMVPGGTSATGAPLTGTDPTTGLPIGIDPTTGLQIGSIDPNTGNIVTGPPGSVPGTSATGAPLGGGTSGLFNFSQTPGGIAYNAALPFLQPQVQAAQQVSQAAQNYLNPVPTSDYLANYGNYLQNTIWPADAAAQGQMSGAGNQVLNTAFDPQSLLYNQLASNNLNQQNALNALSGIANTPYGAAVTGQNQQLFNENWLNQQLAREQTGSAAAASDFAQANTLGNAAAQAGVTGSLLPASGLAQLAQLTNQVNAPPDLSQYINYGNAMYQLPQQVLQDLQSYLKLGQSASTISGDLGQQGFNQTQQAFQGIGSAIGTAGNFLGLNNGGLGSMLGLGAAGGGGGAGAASLAALNGGAIDALAPTAVGSTGGLGALGAAAPVAASG